jgi:hypothetical protein
MEAIEAAAKLGDPDALRCALDEKEACSSIDWDDLMECAIQAGSIDCVKVLYDKGYEQHRFHDDGYWHPATFAIRHGQAEIIRFVVDHSGPPDPVFVGVEERRGDAAVYEGARLGVL